VGSASEIAYNKARMKRTVALIILDGWGIGTDTDSNPVHAARPQTIAEIEKRFPAASLQASGIAVGLPWGETGSSEVGHVTLGAGKVVYQSLPRITMAIDDGTFFENPALAGAFAHAQKNNSAVHLVGLLTNANIHSSLNHLAALVDMANRCNVKNVQLDLFADGKDSPPGSVRTLLDRLPGGTLSTLTGRYYAMDRNENWQLTAKTYACLAGTGGEQTKDIRATVDAFLKKGLSEDLLPPTRVSDTPAIRDNDAVIFFNFREDGVKQLFAAFTDPGFSKFPRQQIANTHIVTMTSYGTADTLPVAFPPETVTNPIGRVLADNGKTQLRLTESYKYAHVTYFFNGYREEPFKNEYRVTIPSLNLIHPEEHPELMAPAITDRLVEALSNRAFDFILVNYSNPDTIAHTGNFDACLKTVRVIDRELDRVLRAAIESNAVLVITADHGNIEQVLDPRTGERETQHNASPVPFYLVAPEFEGRRFGTGRGPGAETIGILADVAPTILELLQIKKPPEMTGRNLLADLAP
jgi:2,3-bisphosphoglycerate-independent phosphoglycerate mutase